MLEPLKPLPKYLIYSKKLTNTKRKVFEHILFSTKTGEELGFMITGNITGYHRDINLVGEQLGIDYLKSYKPNQGVGTALINFAKFLSRDNGYNGYICLKADGTMDTKRAPHQFYRKMGFTTLNDKIDKKIDRFNSKQKQATYKDLKCMLMFYPPINAEKKQGFWSKLLNEVKELFKQM